VFRVALGAASLEYFLQTLKQYHDKTPANDRHDIVGGFVVVLLEGLEEVFQAGCPQCNAVCCVLDEGLQELLEPTVFFIDYVHLYTSIDIILSLSIDADMPAYLQEWGEKGRSVCPELPRRPLLSTSTAET